MMNADGLDQASLDIIREGKHALEPSAAAKNRVRQRVMLRLGTATVVLLASRSLWGMLGKWALIVTAAGATLGGLAYVQLGDSAASRTTGSRQFGRIKQAAPALAEPALPRAPQLDVPQEPVVQATSEPSASAVPNVVRPKPRTNHLAAEIASLAAANAALHRGDAASARRLLQEYDSKFGSGVLKEERAAAEVFLKCALGNLRGAQAAAARFESRWPKSPLKARVRSSCAAQR